MRLFAIYIAFLLLLFSCGDQQNRNVVTKNQSPQFLNEAFFYSYDTIPRIYKYRDVVHGMRENFHRVYGIRDAFGPHIIVEKYIDGRRLTEAYNYSKDSLKVMDHMVVDAYGKYEKAMIYRNDLFPEDTSDVYFASKFSGLTDSTVLFFECYRKIEGFEERTIMNKKTDCMKLNEVSSITNMDVTSRKESKPMTRNMNLFFGEGLGLVEWYDDDKIVHYVLEEILTQEEWIKLISR